MTYERGEGSTWHQVEVVLLEHEAEYVHVSLSVDDGSLLKVMLPLSHSFIVYRDGRVDK